jgi:hypothetical protein
MKPDYIEISFGQVSVFNSSLEQPFNDWEDVHIAQGFAWRHGSVSFLVSDQGTHEIEFDLRHDCGEVEDLAVTVIEVPFEVFEGGAIEYGGISDLRETLVPQGNYSLRFEEIPPSGGGFGAIRLTLFPGAVRRFEIIRPDRERGTLLAKDARPAV